MGMLGVIPSIKMNRSGIRFQYEENNSRLVESLKEDTLASSVSAYEKPRQHVPMIFMDSGGGFNYGNDSQ